MRSTMRLIVRFGHVRGPGPRTCPEQPVALVSGGRVLRASPCHALPSARDAAAQTEVDGRYRRTFAPSHSASASTPCCCDSPPPRPPSSPPPPFIISSLSLSPWR